MSVESVSTSLVWVGSKSRAEELLAGIAADDPETFSAEIIDIDDVYELRIHVSGNSLKNVRSTVVDLLACLGAIESTLNTINDEST